MQVLADPSEREASLNPPHLLDSSGPIKTQCQDEVRILSGSTQKLKVAKQCWKQLNEHNLMYIYHKQCENMQKIQ